MLADTPATYEELDQWLSRTPVVADLHPLVPLCLQRQIRLITDAKAFLNELDDCVPHRSEPALIMSPLPELLERFPRLQVIEHPPIEAINGNMQFHLDYARQHLLTTRGLASHIEQDVTLHPADVVVLLLIDGLNYGDTLRWGGKVQPCFVDGPSVTYRFYDDDKRNLVESVGFASIINRPSIYNRLYNLGYHQARGYTYWNRDNVLAEYMFAGVPQTRVTSFENVLQLLSEEVSSPRYYVQIVREGLDGLAHDKRELRPAEIETTIQTIFDDTMRVLELFRQKRLNTRLFLTADHGILWKSQHSFKLLTGLHDSKPRFTWHKPPELLANTAVRMDNGGIIYYLFSYPYLGRNISSNDSGVHGGFSYQESFVPFATFEV
jgi:hypothetical protein